MTMFDRFSGAIALAFSGDNSAAGSLDTIGQLFAAVLVFIFVLALAYYATRMLAKSRLPKKGSNFELLDSMPIGQSSALQIVRVGQKVILIGVTKDRITKLDDLNDIEISRDSLKSPAFMPFDKYLSGVLKKGGGFVKKRFDKDKDESYQTEDE